MGEYYAINIVGGASVVLYETSGRAFVEGPFLIVRVARRLVAAAPPETRLES